RRPLLCSQRGARIDARRASGGQQRGENGNRGQNQGGADQRRQIGRGDVEEQARQEPARVHRTEMKSKARATRARGAAAGIRVLEAVAAPEAAPRPNHSELTSFVEVNL